MPQQNNRTAIRSTAVNEIIGRRPGFLIRFGNLIFLLILLMIAAAAYWIRYPDVISTSGRMLADSTVRGGCTAEIVVPGDKAAQVSAGQKVLLKLSAYPYREYGTVEGRVTALLKNAADSSCRARVVLVNGLVTSHRRKLAFSEGLVTDADIILAERRLAGRLLDKLRHSFAE